MSTPRHHRKLEETRSALQDLVERFSNGDPRFRHSLNNFVVCAQATLHVLQKQYSRAPGFKAWADDRTSRFPRESRAFKTMRNATLKEDPVEDSDIVIGFELPGGMPAHAEFVGPWIDTTTGHPVGLPVIRSRDGVELDLPIVVHHDFTATIAEHGSQVVIPNFITTARAYLETITAEVAEADRRFGAPLSPKPGSTVGDPELIG